MQLQKWSLDELQNVGHSLGETATRMPAAIAVACPNTGSPTKPNQQRTVFETITFAELESASNQIALGIQQLGVQPGTRMALMIPPGIDFVAHVFGLFKAGVVVILIDPGMGKKNMIRCLADARPEGMVGIRKAHFARNLFRFRFPLCKTNVSVGRWPGCTDANSFKKLDSANFKPVDCINRESEAAIIFTTGSTGPPKGVLYRHRVFIEQARQIRDYFDINPGSTDVSGFPLFALFNTAMGTTTVFPKMDATRPADVHPPDIFDAIEQFDADQSFGSPALWNTVSNYCVKHSIKLPSIKRILSAGAPVPPDVLQRIKSVIGLDGEAYTPYGATESLPVACNSATVILNETAERTRNGFGTCVGNRFPDMNWRVIKISDESLTDISDCENVPSGEVGELIVQGAVVTDQYVTRTEANEAHKIKDNDSFWHRMGDVGYLDDQERFWFCGRKAHRVRTESEILFTIPCEGILNAHPNVYRTALVGVGIPGQETPVIVAEPIPEFWTNNQGTRESQLISELKSLAAGHWQTDNIHHFLIRKSLPVDIRHNSKIFREQLRTWAANKI
jgi:acyl-CoA synthetase (AMP-forming)/AMP-acid ligase II